jgi:hypothetical protein
LNPPIARGGHQVDDAEERQDERADEEKLQGLPCSIYAEQIFHAGIVVRGEVFAIIIGGRVCRRSARGAVSFLVTIQRFHFWSVGGVVNYAARGLVTCVFVQLRWSCG